jgi:hypothetical protein
VRERERGEGGGGGLGYRELGARGVENVREQRERRERSGRRRLGELERAGAWELGLGNMGPGGPAGYMFSFF